MADPLYIQPIVFDVGKGKYRLVIYIAAIDYTSPPLEIEAKSYEEANEKAVLALQGLLTEVTTALDKSVT